MTDADLLYGSGLASEIEAIVLHGIRSGDTKGLNLASMPAYAREKPYAAEPIPPLQPAEIGDVIQYLFDTQHRPHDARAAERGAAIYNGKGGCYDCHGSDASGNTAIGAPNLSDSSTLYGDGSADSLFRSIASGRAGCSPAFSRALSPLQARAVAVYVASLPRRNGAGR